MNLPCCFTSKTPIMAFSKQSLYNIDLQILAGFAKAIGYSGRIEMLLFLEAEGPCTVKELAKGHPICAETLSQHLKILREAQLVIAEEKYPYTIYRIHKGNMARMRKAFAWFFSQFDLELKKVKKEVRRKRKRL